jgi:hypothetical protein
VQKLTDREIGELLSSIFPLGFEGKDVAAEVAPNGWRMSPLAAVFHPTPEQIWKEALRVHRNMECVPSRRKRCKPGRQNTGIPWSPDERQFSFVRCCLAGQSLSIGVE